MTTLTHKGLVFKNYNKMRADGAEQGRLNRALGLAQTQEERPYVTTATFCNCPDATYRNNVCKHILAERMQEKPKETVEEMGRRINEELFS